LIFLVLIGKFDSITDPKSEPVQEAEVARNRSDKTEISELDLKADGFVYVIQVGEFAGHQQARAYSLKFSNQGYPVEIFETLPPGSTKTNKVYLVRIGSYATLEAAQAEKQKLEAQENSKFFIARSPRKGE